MYIIINIENNMLLKNFASSSEAGEFEEVHEYTIHFTL